MRVRQLTIATTLVLLLGAGHALGGELTADGLWQALDDDSHQPTGWFLIRDHDGVYEGMIVKMFLQQGERADVVCDQCTDDRRDRPWLGLDIIRGMKRDGFSYTDGTILDPRYGRIYNAKMTLTPDGQTLVVRGYLGISLLGQNQYWRRLPEAAFNEVDPRFNPNRPEAAYKSKAKPENSAGR